MASIAAVDELDVAIVPRKFLVCLGFGIDTFHGVCHAHVLESIADLARTGDYLGAFSLLEQMPEVQRFREAAQYVLEKTPGRKSIVVTSILSALEGRFGNFHGTERTLDSELFINPLMALYWCFRLDAVARRIIYLNNRARQIESFFDFGVHIQMYRQSIPASIRPWA